MEPLLQRRHASSSWYGRSDKNNASDAANGKRETLPRVRDGVGREIASGVDVLAGRQVRMLVRIPSPPRE